MLVYGFHAVEEMLRKSAGGTLYLARSDPRARSIQELAHAAATRVTRVSSRELDRMCGTAGHQGVALRPDRPEAVHEEGALAPSSSRGAAVAGPRPAPRPATAEAIRALGGQRALVLLLDEITDPHNFGAILRTADQFAVDLVVTSQRKSARDSQTVLKTSAGASLHVPVAVVANLAQAMKVCKEEGFWVYGAALEGELPQEGQFDGRVALVLGSEGRGLRRLVRERCDALVRIPTAGHVDSLNVSVAAGVLLYEVRRQQGFPHLPV